MPSDNFSCWVLLSNVQAQTIPPSQISAEELPKAVPTPSTSVIIRGEMIALDNQPLSIVENTGFRNLMRNVKPKYHIPGRKYFTENIIPQLYEETKSEIRRGVMSAAAISVTTDTRTNINGKLVQDVCTRWNSTCYMISRLFEQKRAVSLYLAETSVNFENLSNEEWQILGKSIELLKPFEEITKIISSSCSSVSEVIPHLKTLQKYLEMYYDENKEIMEMKALLENDLNIRFDMDHNKIFTLATLLDPRYKQQFFETEDLITIRSQFLLESLKNSMSDDDSDSGKDDLESTSTDENNIETATHRNF
ncbi:Zinc finger BED domain-containing protein 4 [Eumeta japonica]|uniref:Zinc finger BED domain-containing protein 4 n=1 Tax=Eumeta variegata TaxID=151549 RepID=A0A4C1SAC5_EUMVA|nr:Zinc finger BED domain-containing protein 4 [Eumeta japonica]